MEGGGGEVQALQCPEAWPRASGLEFCEANESETRRLEGFFFNGVLEFLDHPNVRLLKAV